MQELQGSKHSWLRKTAANSGCALMESSGWTQLAARKERWVVGAPNSWQSGCCTTAFSTKFGMDGLVITWIRKAAEDRTLSSPTILQ